MKKKPKAIVKENFVIIENNYEKIKSLGVGKIEHNKLILDFLETYYLIEKNMIEIDLSKEEFLNLAIKKIPKFLELYKVYKFFKDRNYIVKSGFKYGFDFRIYEVSEEEHARYLVKVFYEDDQIKLKDIVGLYRIAHSVRKELLIAIVSRENDILIYNIKWEGGK